ncbi:hypothetical protein pb186bvf_007608 [Paramecium bursaria]
MKNKVSQFENNLLKKNIQKWERTNAERFLEVDKTKLKPFKESHGSYANMISDNVYMPQTYTQNLGPTEQMDVKK